MRRFAFILAALAALTLAACAGIRPQTGPGVSDSCAAPEVPTIPSPAEGGAAAAATKGGQEASNQPVMTDPARIAPQTVWNRGAGPNTNSPTSTESRSQAGAPSVNQGLIIPATAQAGVANIADNPAVRAILDRMADLRAAWKDAVGRGAMDAATALSAQLDAAEARLLAATSSAGGGGAPTYYIYDLRGSRNSQIVANGSKSGDAPGGAITPTEADVIGRSAADVTKNAIGAEPAVVPDGPPSGLPAAPK